MPGCFNNTNTADVVPIAEIVVSPTWFKWVNILYLTGISLYMVQELNIPWADIKLPLSNDAPIGIEAPNNPVAQANTNIFF